MPLTVVPDPPRADLRRSLCGKPPHKMRVSQPTPSPTPPVEAIELLSPLAPRESPQTEEKTNEQINGDELIGDFQSEHDDVSPLRKAQRLVGKGANKHQADAKRETQGG